MQIEAYDSSHADAIARLSLRAWSPVFDSLKEALEPNVYQTFYPDGWRPSQEKAVRDACASSDMKVWVAIEAGAVAGFVAIRFHEGAMVETGGDPGHAPARAAYEKAGFRVLPLARYFKKL